MENYTIQIHGADIYFRPYLEESEEYGLTDEEIAEMKEFMKKEEVEVHSLKEYFDLIEKVSDLSNGEFSIFNGGMLIAFDY